MRRRPRTSARGLLRVAAFLAFATLGFAATVAVAALLARRPPDADQPPPPAPGGYMMNTPAAEYEP